MALKIEEIVDPGRAAYRHIVTGKTPAQRLREWRGLMQDRYLNVQGTDQDALDGRIAGQAFSGGYLARWTLSRQKLVRTPGDASRMDDDFFFVSAMISGRGTHEQDGRTYDLVPGDFIVVDAKHAFASVTASPCATKAYLHVRKSAFVQRVGMGKDLAPGLFKAGPPLQKLAFSFLRDLTDLVGHADPVTLAALAGQSLDLVALLARDMGTGGIEPSSHQSAMLLRLKMHLKSNLRHPGLSLQTVASALGVSPRYVNALLALEGTSLGRYVLGHRLDGARRDITDPRLVHRQITEIAFDWGFNNVSHFGRAFRERFDMTPRDAKTLGTMQAIRAAA